METIKNYLDNIFQALPKTDEVLQLKLELLSDMEAKYHELRQAGKTENEAIGKVIGEFGNIDELLDEIGLVAAEKDDAPIVTLDEAREFLAVSSKAAHLVASGVAVIMVGVAIFVDLSGLSGNFPITPITPILSETLVELLPVVLLLIMIIPAVALFIYSGALMERFKFIEDGSFNLNHSAQAILKEEVITMKPKWTIAIITGVSLCIFSAALLIALSGLGDNFSILGVSLLLIIIAVAVFIFIRSGSSSSAYEKLLKTGEFAPKEKHTSKVIGGVASLVWPIAVCIFLVWGFIYDGWGISWIVFPITGILFGGFSALYSALSKK